MNTDYRKKFRANLLKYIEASGKTQTEIAKGIGINPQTLNSWCTGGSVPRIDIGNKLANYLGIPFSSLMDTGNHNHYYYNEDAREFAEFLFKNPEYRVLFSAARDVKKEDLLFVKTLLDKFKDKE